MICNFRLGDKARHCKPYSPSGFQPEGMVVKICEEIVYWVTIERTNRLQGESIRSRKRLTFKSQNLELVERAQSWGLQ